MMNNMETTGKFGIGVDIESINRFAGLEHPQDSPFLKKIFTQQELEYCYSKKTPAPHLTARFAGKEAIIKALCNMDRPKSNYRDIEIVNDRSGAPVVRIGKTGFQDLQIKLSLSHCEDKAIAFAIVTETK